MKTNFLYFRENGLHTTTVAGAYGGNQDFTLLDDSGSNVEFDFDIAADGEVKVEVTFLEAQTTKCGSAYSGGSVDAGETIEINATGKSLESGGVIRIAKQTGDGTNGVTLSTGDIVTISLRPVEGTEACFRADRLLAVNSSSDTVTHLRFKSSNGGVTDDTVALTHPDTNGAEFKIIADYIHEVCNANITERGGVITCWDNQNNVIGKGLAKAGVTKMVLVVA